MEAVCVVGFFGIMASAKVCCSSGKFAEKMYKVFGCMAPIIWMLNLGVNALVIVIENFAGSREFYEEICKSCPVVYYADENYPTANSSSSLGYLTPLPSKTTNYTCEPGPNHLSNLIGVIVPDAAFVSHPAISVIRVLLAGGCVFLSFVAIVSTKEAHRLGQSVFLGHVSKKTDKGLDNKVKGDYSHYWFCCFALAILEGGGVYTIAQMPFDQTDAWFMFGGLIGGSFAINAFLQKYAYGSWSQLTKDQQYENAGNFKGLFGDAIMSLLFFMGTMGTINSGLGLDNGKSDYSNFGYMGGKFTVAFTGMMLPFILMNVGAAAAGTDSIRNSDCASKLGMIGIAGVFFGFLIAVFVNDGSCFFAYKNEIFVDFNATTDGTTVIARTGGGTAPAVGQTVYVGQRDVKVVAVNGDSITLSEKPTVTTGSITVTKSSLGKWPEFEGKNMDFHRLITPVQASAAGRAFVSQKYCTVYKDSMVSICIFFRTMTPILFSHRI